MNFYFRNPDFWPIVLVIEFNRFLGELFMMKSLSLTFFKLGCLWLLTLSFSVLPSVAGDEGAQEAPDCEEGSCPDDLRFHDGENFVACGGDGQDECPKLGDCSEAVSAAAEAAVGMDMTSYLAVQQTVGSVNETVSKGNVKKAYKGSALINTTMASVALTRCRKCKDAMQRLVKRFVRGKLQMLRMQ